MRVRLSGADVWMRLVCCLPQLHDWAGLQDTRRELLVSRGNNKQNWIGYMLCHFLTGNYDVAAEIVTCYESTLNADQPADAESSEIALFKALVRVCGLFGTASLKAGGLWHDEGNTCLGV